MAFVSADRVKETTTTTGTGTLTLAGAVSGFQSFGAIGNSNTCNYGLLDANGTAWEVGVGTYTLSGTTLARTTILASSNSGSAINLSSGTHTVFGDFPALAAQSWQYASRGYIIGCNPQWASSTQLTILTGQLHIEGTDSVINVAAQTITPSSPSASTWYHGYVNNSGTFSVSTSAPVLYATNSGFARSKTGDTNSRYVGSFLTGASGTFFRFTCQENGIWRWGGSSVGNIDGSPFRVLTAGSATTSTSIDASGCIPVTGRLAIMLMQNTSTGTQVGYVTSADQSAASNQYDAQCVPIGAGNNNMPGFAIVPCDATQKFNYVMSAGSGALYMDIYGFVLQR